MREARMDDDSRCSNEITLSISNYPDRSWHIRRRPRYQNSIGVNRLYRRYCKQTSQFVRLELYSREPSLDLHVSIPILTLAMYLDVLA
jgi:hypothetical protein